MPDLNNPQYDSMPDPGINYSYMQNQQLMNIQQANLQGAMNTATNNAQQHLQEVLAGTMTASMAIYNTGKSITDRANEYIYGDTLKGGGNYVLERSAWRDFMWGMGVSSSEFGRAMKLGGRRPEFLSSEEFQYQRERSWGYRKEELTDMMIGGGFSMAGSAIGTAIMPGLGTIGGLAVGYALDQTVGKFVAPYLDYRRAGREMHQFAETTNINMGAGQRRMSGDVADRLGRELLSEDRTAAYYIPIIGEAIDKRLRPETDPTKMFKKMSQMDLMREINPDDIEAVKKHIKETTEIVDKFAGLLHMTRDSVLAMKATFNKIGFNTGQQNAALTEITKATMSTGLPAEMMVQAYGNFIQTGMQTGYYNANTPGIQGRAGLEELARIKAGQEAGNISRIYDPGTLATQQFVNASQLARSPYGLVTQYGNGNVGMAASELRGKYGSIGLGLALQDTDYGNTGDPIQIHKNIIKQEMDMFRKHGMNFENATAAILFQEPTREGRNDAYREIMGVNALNEHLGKVSARTSYLTERGLGQEKGIYESFRVNSLRGKNPLSSSDIDALSHAERLKNFVINIEGKGIDKESSISNEVYKNIRNTKEFTKSVSDYWYGTMANLDEKSTEAIKESEINQILNDNPSLSREEAERIFNTGTSDVDRYNSSSDRWKFGSHIRTHDKMSLSAKEMMKYKQDQTIVGYLGKQERRFKLNEFSQKDYNDISLKLNRGDIGNTVLKQLAEAGDNRDKVKEILQSNGLINLSKKPYDPRNSGYVNEVDLAIMAVNDYGRYNYSKSDELGAFSSFKTMLKTNKDKLSSYGITNEQDYEKFRNIQLGIKGSIQNISNNLMNGKNITNDDIKKLAHLAAINPGFNEDSLYHKLIAEKGDITAFTKDLENIVKNPNNVNETTPGMKSAQDLNLDAIQKLAAACDAISHALANR